MGGGSGKGVLAMAPALWAAGMVLLLLCSFNTSPLNPFYGGDGHFFALMGRMTSQGYLPFADVYDQKGPLVFYINALGWLLLPGKWGVLLVQSVFLAASMGLVYGLCRLWGGVRQSLAGLAMFMAVYAACLWGGNMTEEYSLPLVLLPSWLILRHLRHGGGIGSLPWQHLLLAGVCLGLLAFLRLNNAAPLCGALLGLAFCLHSWRDPLYLVRHALVALLGLLLAALPILAYFHAHGAAEAMLTGTFIHNWHYALGHTADRSTEDTVWVMARTTSLLLLFTALCFAKAESPTAAHPDARRVLLGFATVGTLVPALGPASSHYFIMAAPAIGIAFTIFLGNFSCKIPGALVGAALLLAPFGMDTAHLVAGFRRYNCIRNYQEDIDAARRIADCIPAAERNQVLAYDVHASIYTYGGLTPCHRYFTMQSEMAFFNPDIEPATRRLMETAPPLWLILPHGSTPAHPAIQQALEDGSYSLIHSETGTLNLDLWRLRH